MFKALEIVAALATAYHLMSSIPGRYRKFQRWRWKPLKDSLRELKELIIQNHEITRSILSKQANHFFRLKWFIGINILLVCILLASDVVNVGHTSETPARAEGGDENSFSCWIRSAMSSLFAQTNNV